MPQVDLSVLRSTVEQAVANADRFNKIWVASAAVVAALFAALLTAFVQLYVARRQREEQAEGGRNQLDMQELVSRRTSIANIAAKRQVWIDELRNDLATYLSLWQDIAFRWAAIVDKYSANAFPGSMEDRDKMLEAFSAPIAEMRLKGHEIRIRIELRLNPNEENHRTLIEQMEVLEKSTELFNRTISNKPTAILLKETNSTIKNCIVTAKQILKEEWERIKKESFVNPTNLNLH